MGSQNKHYPTRTKVLTAASLLTLCGLLAGWFVVSESKSAAFVSLNEVPKGTKVEALLETRQGTEELQHTGSGFDLPAFKTLAGDSYRIRTSLQMPWGDYRDITLNVDQGKSSISILADGFTEEDLITMTMAGHVVYQNMPMDWSGRLELQAALPKKKNTTACITVGGRLGSVGICHAISGEVS